MTVLLRPTTTALRRWARVLMVPAVAFALLVPAAAAQAEDETVGIAGGPANETGPDGRSRFSYSAGPGQNVADRFVVRNTGTTEQTVTVFGSDAYNTNDGAFALLETGDQPVDAGSWVTFAGAPSAEVTLAPGAQQVLDFTVTVPADATPGDHAAGIVVSAQAAEGQVVVDRRVATRLYVRVSGPLTPALTISSIAASQTQGWNPFNGPVDVTVTVQNTGNVALAADVSASVTSWFGMAASSTAREELPELLPGTTREVTFRVPSVARWGYLKPVVQLDPKASTDATAPGELQQVVRDTSLVAVPWVLLGLVVVVVGLVLGVRWRRRYLTRQAEAWAEYTREEARREAQAGTSAGAEVAG